MFLVQDLRGDLPPHQIILLHARWRDRRLARSCRQETALAHVRLQAPAEIDVAAEGIGNDVLILGGRKTARHGGCGLGRRRVPAQCGGIGQQDRACTK